MCQKAAPSGKRVGARVEKNEQANVFRLTSSINEHKGEGRANFGAPCAVVNVRAQGARGARRDGAHTLSRILA
jgi:hypothetical protein